MDILEKRKMAKEKFNMVNVPESEAIKIMCPQLQRNCVGSKCASCTITGITEAENPDEAENLITCNNPNVNLNPELSDFRNELLKYMDSIIKLSSPPMFPNPKAVKLPKKKKAAKKKK